MMLAPIRQEFVLAINGSGADFLELRSVSQRRKQRIGIHGGIGAEFAFNSLAEKSHRVFLSTADGFVHRCRVADFRVRNGSHKVTKTFRECLDLRRRSLLEAGFY